MPAFSPDDLKIEKAKSIPQWFLNIINDLLVKNYNGPNKSITLYQDDIIDSVLASAEAKAEGMTRNEIFNSGYINFEAAYENVGWNVTYDKPSYDDNYKAYFKFSPKSN